MRRATNSLHHFAAAGAAGYTNQYPAGCAQSPSGVQGFHYLNPGLVDATVELLRPELVMYEPQRDGSLQLIGVDYVVPFDAWTSSEPPSLLGMPFMRNEPLGVWALHIWAWRPNPERHVRDVESEGELRVRALRRLFTAITHTTRRRRPCPSS